ncbi:MAG TPA: hypothetical protein VMW69_10880 [Spirochaetia bacterium]|nr:hypothetical protein [Spirochaetia bacterium]
MSEDEEPAPAQDADASETPEAAPQRPIEPENIDFKGGDVKWEKRLRSTSQEDE